MARMSEAPDEYDAAWDDLRRRRRAFFFPMQIGICIVIAALASRLVSGELEWLDRVLVVAFGVSLLFTFIGGVRGGRFHCPRCGKVFNRMDKCGHCGLHAFESKEWQFVDLRKSP
jgi:hypothetical protein